jgi:disulfide bond formation protein DsbB
MTKQALDVEQSPSLALLPRTLAWLRAGSCGQFALAAALIGFASFGAALGLQHWMGLEPCPLCIFQRVAVLLSSGVLLAAGWALGRKPVLGRVLLALAVLAAMTGLGIALKHMHVMWFPQDVSCGPDLEYLMEAFPPTKWLPKVFAGEAECAAAARQLVLGLPIPIWSALLFMAQLGLAACAWFRRQTL